MSNLKDLCINMNNHLDNQQSATLNKKIFPQVCAVHQLGNFLNSALSLLGQSLRKLPIWQKLNFANHPYLCKGLLKYELSAIVGFIGLFLLPFSVYALPADVKKSINVQAYTVIIDESLGRSIYTGDAKVTQGSLMLSAEKISLFHPQKNVSKVVAKGSKNKHAHYQQNQINQLRFVEATAQKITYLADKQRILLEGQAHLIQGFDSFSGGSLEYDIKNDSIIAKKSNTGTQRVKFKIKL
ncbi:LptA, protein essential for LPS transport across the periplasm [uncultured Candidatus Thioglobus sp.]|nr:LptA, protein essential for LPS transport across the periplasm [uncultured Candidatus Thioglobus sp.]